MTSGLHTQQEAKRITYDPFISAYKKKYSIKEMGEIKLFIKIAVSRNRIQRTITLSQETYITEMVPKPDISYNVSLLCRFSSRPSPEAWRALVKVLQYLYKTRKRAITYGGPLQLNDRLTRTKPPIDPTLHNKLMGLHIYSDASWKTESTYAGFVIMYNNAALDWGSKLLKCSTLPH